MEGKALLESIGARAEAGRARELLNRLPELGQLKRCPSPLSGQDTFQEWLEDLPHAVLRGDDDRLNEVCFDGHLAIAVEPAAATSRTAKRRNRPAASTPPLPPHDEVLAIASDAAPQAAVALQNEFADRIKPGTGIREALAFSRRIDAVWTALRPTLPDGGQAGLAEIMQLRGWQVTQAIAILERGVPGPVTDHAAAVAVSLARTVLEDCERFLGARHAETLNAADNLAGAYSQAGDYDGACALLARILRNADAATLDQPDMLLVRHNLGFMQLAAGRPRRARQILREVLTAREAVLGSDDSRTKQTRDLLRVAQERLSA